MNRMEYWGIGGALLCWMAETCEVCRTTLLCFGVLWLGSGVGTVGPVVDNGVVWRTVWDDGIVQCCLWGSTIVMDAEDVEYLWRCLCSW